MAGNRLTQSLKHTIKAVSLIEEEYQVADYRSESETPSAQALSVAWKHLLNAASLIRSVVDDTSTDPRHSVQSDTCHGGK